MNRTWLLKLFIFTILTIMSHAALAGSVRIMPTGDSDTSGWPPYMSYRYDLWFLLDDAGFDVDFVGRVQAATGGFDAALYPRHEEMDPNHEAWRTNTISDMVANAAFLVQTNRPHVVLWKGSVDICFSGAGAAAIMRNRLPEMIDAMRAVDPNLHFVLATSYDWWSNCEPDARSMIPDFNQAIMDVANAKDTPQSRVLIADHYTGYNIETMYDTGRFHSNREGERFLAQRSFQALEGLLPTIEVQENNFSINAGLNDAWFDPTTAGQGFFITVFPDIEMMFLAWFTFDTERPDSTVQAILGEAGHRWLTAFGPYDGNQAILDVELTRGGVFDAASPVPESVADGTIVVDFNGCNAALVSYDIESANVSGEIPIQRIANDNVVMCEALAE